MKFADYCGKIRRIMLHNLEFAGQSPCLTSRTCDASSVLAIDPGIGICHLESFSTPNGPVNHFMAVKSVSFEAICGSSGVLFSRNVKKTLHNRLVSDTKDSLPGYATQIVLTANICYRSVHCLFPMDWLLSLRYCQDMLRKDSQNMHKVALTQEDILTLMGEPLLIDEASIMRASIHFYDQRGGGIETSFGEDKSGLGITKRNKKRFEAQRLLMLLGTLAHNLLIWSRRWLCQTAPELAIRLRQYGIKRMLRDLYHISGILSFDKRERLRVI